MTTVNNTKNDIFLKVAKFQAQEILSSIEDYKDGIGGLVDALLDIESATQRLNKMVTSEEFIKAAY